MNAPRNSQTQTPKTFSREYLSAFHDYIRGGQPGAALYEGNPGPNYLVPTLVDGRVIPFPSEVGAIRRLASVITTTSDIRFTPLTANGVVTSKPEGTPFGTSTTIGFTGVTLRAYVAGAENLISMEAAADIPAFTNRLATVMVPAQNAREEYLFLYGSGVNEPQGLIGNVDVGGSFPADAAGNLVSIDGTDSLIDTLPATFHARAAWLMTRATARIIRRAQRQSGLVDRVWTREGGQDFLHGYPVEFSEEMPAAASGAVPALFGDFQAAYTIADRGGSEICIKVIDQDKDNALAGIVNLLTYRRCDGRVIVPSAIQQYVCA